MMKDFIFSLSNLFTSDMVIPIWIKNMDKTSRSKWTNKFRELGKKKGSRKDFINLYKEMKKEKDEKKEITIKNDAEKE